MLVRYYAYGFIQEKFFKGGKREIQFRFSYVDGKRKMRLHLIYFSELFIDTEKSAYNALGFKRMGLKKVDMKSTFWLLNANFTAYVP